ncbi:hypothetical protein [Fowlpox virus]|nr:hypothetical protein [Fowlpox virus]
MENQQVISNLYYLFSEKYLEKLNQHPDTNNVRCGIHIGYLSGEAKNCIVSIINACNSNEQKSFQLLIESLIETIENLPEKQQKEIAKSIGINIDDYKAGKKTELQQHCEAYANLTQHIDIQHFNIGTCYSPNDKYTDIKIINTGSALSNCGVEIILNKIKTNNPIVPIDNKLSMESFSIKWFIIYIVLCVLILLLLGYIYRTVRIKYTYGVYI